MDSLKELLITGVIVLVYFILVGKKAKKKQTKPIPGPVFQGEDENWAPENADEMIIEETPKEVPLEEFSTNFPKNEKYFTYETISSTENESLETGDFTSTKLKQNNLQNVENESKKNIDLTFSQDEL